MDEINDIIMRSQVRAQQILTAGSYYSTFIVSPADKSSVYGQLSPLLELTLGSPGIAPMAAPHHQEHHVDSAVQRPEERLLKAVPSQQHNLQQHNVVLDNSTTE